MINRKNILKNKPDYEAYTANEAKLSIEEMRELGLLSCGGCCCSKEKNTSNCSGCQKGKSCCKAK